MLKNLVLSISMISAVCMTGCDNKAKTPLKSNETAVATDSSGTPSVKPITIGYSDWPGWVAWQVAIEKGWLKEAGLNVEFKWFDYSASLAAFTANQLDAVTVTNGDNLINSAGGTKGMIILATDYSAGNDVIIAKSGINKITDLKGKTVATEKGLVDHLLLSTALHDNHMQPSDIKLVNSVTNSLPQVLATPQVDAIAVWQPVANQALKAVAGSKIIYSSKDKPGLIYDTLSVNASSLATHREDWIKILRVWDKTVRYIKDPKTHDDAIKIMAHKVGVPPEQYQQFVDGTHFFNVSG